MAAFLVRKVYIQFLLASLKSSTNSKNPSNYPYHGACCGVQKDAYDMYINLRILTKAKESPNRNFDAASETMCRVSTCNCFHKIHPKPLFIFSH